MARRRGLPPPQLRALDRLKSVRGIERFYLAGGAASYFEEQAPTLVLGTVKQIP